MTERLDEQPLTAALHAVIRARMVARGMSLNALARAVDILSSTLSRRLRGSGTLTVDEYDAIAVAVGARDVEELLLQARG